MSWSMLRIKAALHSTSNSLTECNLYKLRFWCDSLSATIYSHLNIMCWIPKFSRSLREGGERRGDPVGEKSYSMSCLHESCRHCSCVQCHIITKPSLYFFYYLIALNAPLFVRHSKTCTMQYKERLSIRDETVLAHIANIVRYFSFTWQSPLSRRALALFVDYDRSDPVCRAASRSEAKYLNELGG